MAGVVGGRILLSAGNTRHCTPLHISGILRYWNIAEILIKHGSPALTFEVSGGISILHEAASAGALQVLRLILDQPAVLSLNAKDKDESTPLQHAACYGDVFCFQLLLDNGAEVHVGNNLYGGIEHAACYPVSDDIRRTLLDHKVSWEFRGMITYGETDYMDAVPLHRAAAIGNDTCIHFLKDNGFVTDVDVSAEFGITALHFAAYSNQCETLKLLLDMGANVESVDLQYGRTPLN